MARQFKTDLWKRSGLEFTVIVCVAFLVSSCFVNAQIVVKYNTKNEPCVCVWYYLCHDNGTYDNTGMTAIGPRNSIPGDPTPSPESEPLCEAGLGHICCRITLNETGQATLSEPIVPLPNENSLLPRPSETRAREDEDPVPYPVVVPKPGCGVQRIPVKEGVTTDIKSNRTNERYANYAQFPWMLMILSSDETTGLLTVECGASLIQSQFALTAAHCVHGKDPNTLVIRGGEWDIFQSDEPEAHQDRRIRQIITHPSYHSQPLGRDPLHNDIAILVLDSPFDKTNNVDTVCLPLQNEKFNRSRCLATGWGKDNSGRYQRYLRQVELSIVPRQECQSRLRSTRLGPLFTLHDSFICAGGEPGQDSCKGDGGGPLVCPMGDNRWKQVGIVSWGVDCGTSVPGIYVNVPEYTEWILGEMTGFYRNVQQQANLDGIWFGTRELEEEPPKSCASVPAVRFFTIAFLIGLFILHFCLVESLL